MHLLKEMVFAVEVKSHCIYINFQNGMKEKIYIFKTGSQIFMLDLID